MENIITFKNITKKFPGVIAVNDVSFSINRGEIHAIVGENGAGKSTLIHILAGLYKQNSGEIIYDGEVINFNNPLMAKKAGFATVFQEIKLCPSLTVTENIFLGQELRSSFGKVKWNDMKIKVKSLLNSFDIDLNVNSLVKNLTAAQNQVIEIVRAISINAKVLIMDEPTSSLTINEVNKLFETLEILKERGVTILFISHRLEEIFKISDRISVLRDGTYLGTFKTKEVDTNKIISLIVGRELEKEIYGREDFNFKISGSKALEVKSLSSGELVKNISFELYEGEILGFYGLQGSGRTELLETIFGLRKKDSGEIIISGRKININNPAKAIENGIALIPEERRIKGLFDNMNILENMTILHSKRITWGGFLQSGKMNRIAKEFIKKLDIKLVSIKQMIKSLSGGNQQKVIIAKWLSKSPKILLMDEPTRGIDVGTKAEIFNILKDLRKKEKKSILFVSSELSVIIAECDRVLIMSKGKIKGEVRGKNINREKILKYAFM